MYRYKICIEYDGTMFHGWQRQETCPTVQGSLEIALQSLIQEYVIVQGSSRTDKGVHAIKQVAHFDAKRLIPNERLEKGMNFYLKNQRISVSSAENLGENAKFHSRFDVKVRHYIYKICNRNYPITFNKNLFWWVLVPLDTINMHHAAQLLVGTHDMSTFRAAKCQASSAVRTINEISVTREEDIVSISVKAPSFLYHQVRNIVGSLFKVGSYKWDIAEFKQRFLNRNRIYGGITAPAHGLYLVNVTY